MVEFYFYFIYLFYFIEGCIGFFCKNGGKCIEIVNVGFVCICIEGWFGLMCEFFGGKIKKIIINIVFVIILLIFLFWGILSI